jgi:hypothetical protein
MKLSDFLLCLPQSRRRAKGLCDGLAFHSARQAKVGAMAWVIPLRAMTIGFAALAGSGRNRAAAEIADSGKLAEQVRSLGLQLRQ